MPRAFRDIVLALSPDGGAGRSLLLVSPSLTDRSTMLGAMLEIRRFDAADRAAVVRLHHAALGPPGAHLGPGPWDDDLYRIREFSIDAAGEFPVATLDGDLVAMGALRRISIRFAEVRRMRTAPGLQGRGYGRRLLAPP